jgi:hypothetical protein
METGLITIPEESLVLIEQALAFPTRIEAVKIITPEDAQGAVDQTRDIKALAKKLEEHRKSQTDPKRKEIEEIMDRYRPATDALDKAEKALKGAISAWDAEQRRIAAIEAENKRKADQVERDRLAAEQKKSDDLLAQADAAAASGDVAAAEALENQAAQVQTSTSYIATPATIAPEKPKGAAVKQIWKCRVTDPNLVPKEYWVINEKALDAFAKAMKENAKLPGCEFYPEASVSIR